MRVVVIEDNATLNQQLCGLLSENGCETLPAKSEREAENILKEHGGSVAIALVDMFLPAKAQNLDDRESGLRLIQLMTKQYPSIVTVVFTGHGDLANAAKCMEAGAFSYCIKGGEPSELLEKIWKAEAKHQRNQSLRNTARDMREDVEQIHKRLTNLIGAIERLSDEVRDPSRGDAQPPLEAEGKHGL
jgi:DNA-binding NtrC family response regulator